MLYRGYYNALQLIVADGSDVDVLVDFEDGVGCFKWPDWSLRWRRCSVRMSMW